MNSLSSKDTSGVDGTYSDASNQKKNQLTTRTHYIVRKAKTRDTIPTIPFNPSKAQEGGTESSAAGQERQQQTKGTQRTDR